jgi:hypothetical protein
MRHTVLPHHLRKEELKSCCCNMSASQQWDEELKSHGCIRKSSPSTQVTQEKAHQVSTASPLQGEVKSTHLKVVAMPHTLQKADVERSTGGHFRTGYLMLMTRVTSHWRCPKRRSHKRSKIHLLKVVAMAHCTGVIAKSSHVSNPLQITCDTCCAKSRKVQTQLLGPTCSRELEPCCAKSRNVQTQALGQRNVQTHVRIMSEANNGKGYLMLMTRVTSHWRWPKRQESGATDTWQGSPEPHA